MKGFKLFSTLLLFIVAYGVMHAQTNVSGGIYANTTWAITGSPYIVTADVAVFSGFTLAIQPGVVVKFNANQKLWIKPGGRVIAEGTAKDSIRFTKNSAILWNGIFSQGTNSKFDYCNIRYSEKGITESATDSPIKHSTFSYNTHGVYGCATPVDS